MTGRRRLMLAAATALLIAVGLLTPAISADPLPRAQVPEGLYDPGTVLVAYHDDATTSEKAAVEATVGASVRDILGDGTRVLDVATGTVPEVVGALSRVPAVRFAEPDYYLELLATRPNDRDFDQQWALENTGQSVNGTSGTPGADIDAVRAWDVRTTATDVVVGVIDTGVAYDHPDLAGNMWANPGDVPPGPRKCPAGTHGYDFVDGSCDPKDAGSHGTSVAAVLAARGNNTTGGTGVAWRTRIMALRIDAVPILGWGTVSAFIDAVDWVVDARAAGVNVRVLNLSFGGPGHSDAFRDAIRRAGNAGILFVTASGNNSRDIDAGDPIYPCSFRLSTMICVGGSGQDDQYVWNWGPESVHLAAPAGNIYRLPGMAHGNGTSLAAPFVAGTAALVFSEFPHLTPEQVKAKILHNVDVIPSHAGKTVTGGRLNAYRALTGPIPAGPPPSTTSTTAPSGGGGSAPGTAPGSPPPGAGSGGSGSEGSGGGGGSGPGVGGSSDGSGPSGSTGAAGSGDSATGDSGSPRGDRPSGTGTAAGIDGSSTDADADASGANPPGGRDSDTVARYADDGGGRGGWWLVGGGSAALAGAALFTRRRWLPLLPFG